VEGSFSVDGISPTSLAHIFGQRNVVDQVRTALDAADMDHTKMESALLVGPPGLGKSTTARVIAHEMAATFHEVLGQSLTDRSDLNGILLSMRHKDVFHIDEAHELRKRLQTALNLAIDRKRVIVNWGVSPLNCPIADFTLLLSTTDEDRVLQPLRERMQLVLRFDYCSTEDLIRLLDCRCRSLGWTTAKDVVEGIARRCQGTPRLALRLLQGCYRVSRAEGETDETAITVSHFRRACELTMIDDLGLGPNERKYLELLRDGGGRLNVVASSLGLPARTVSDVVEPYLIRSGLVVKDDQCRRLLTAAGREHLSNSCQGGV